MALDPHFGWVGSRTTVSYLSDGCSGAQQTQRETYRGRDIHVGSAKLDPPASSIDGDNIGSEAVTSTEKNKVDY